MKVSDAVRRIVDVVVAVVVLVAGFPVFAAVALVVRIGLGSPVLFAQERAGKGGAPFRLLKFRTMAHPVPGREGAEFDAERLGRVGSFLRSASLDELPGFWNLLKGDLTLVGPRPLPMAYIPRYLPYELTRLDVKPGFTGLAQVNGRNAVGWDERLELDAEYVATRTLWGDARIVLRTIPMVLGRRGISNDASVTMTPLPADRGSSGTNSAP